MHINFSKKYIIKLRLYLFTIKNVVIGSSSSWSVINATVKDPNGKSLMNWRKNKLSLWSYSPSFVGKLSLDKFKRKILFDKNRPNASIFHFRNQYNFGKQNGEFLCLIKSIKS